jgi:hypothetical protein
MDKESKIFIENQLCLMWCKLRLDKPNNWDAMVDFVIEDVEVTSGYLIDGDFHSGDVEIAFRRFVESRSLTNNNG